MHGFQTGDNRIGDAVIRRTVRELGHAGMHTVTRVLAESLLNFSGARLYLDSAPGWEHATWFEFPDGYVPPEDLLPAFGKVTAFLVAQANDDNAELQRIYTEAYQSLLLADMLTVFGIILASYLARPLPPQGCDPQGLHALLTRMEGGKPGKSGS